MKYTQEFKEEALKLSDETGVRNAAARPGLPYYTLADWRGQRKQRQPKPPVSQSEQDKRIHELERENAELKTADEILKDALGFFAKDREK